MMKKPPAVIPLLVAASLLAAAVPVTGQSGTAPAPTSFAAVVERAGPSVVTVFTTKTVRRLPQSNPLLEDPRLRRFFGLPFSGNGRRAPKVEGLGSGVIVSPDGYILTNNHVIEGADEIKVSIGLERKEYEAKKIGTDPGTDIALLKIDATGLPAAEFGDSDKLRVGDVVLAIGSPYGLRQTVTMGIVSALGRNNVHATAYEDFIQTDAAINVGNSGGALVDTQGRLIGINAAIFSQSGGNVGIGFAVPSNLARSIMESLRREGRVIRSYLGVVVQPLDDELADAFNLQQKVGALVSEVTPNSPAEKAGIENGDLITAVNGTPIRDSAQLRMLISSMKPGTKVTVDILRGRAARRVEAVLAELPSDRAMSSSPGSGEDEDNPNALDGVTVDELSPDARRQFDIPRSVQGALVTEVDADSPAAEAGLQPGDVIQEINRKRIASADEAVDVSRKIRKGESVLLRVYSRGGTRYLVVKDRKE